MLTGNRIATPSGSKSNVIVVQKAQAKRLVAQAAAGSPGGASNSPGAQTVTLPKSPPGSVSSAFEKELVSFIQRQDSQKQQKVILDKKGGIAKHIIEAPKKVSHPDFLSFIPS